MTNVIASVLKNCAKDPRTEQTIQLMRYSEIREEDTSPFTSIRDLRHIPHKSPSTYYGFLFWHFKEGYITARVFFLFLFFFVIFNVRFELSELEMTCRVKLGIIMPSLVTVQNAALGRFSTDRQYPVLLYIPCKFWL